MKIVIIDDSESDRYLARRAIEKECADATVVEYEAAYLALGDFVDDDRFASTFGGPQPVVVLLDINMPRMSGFEFLDRICDCRDKESTVVVMFSSSSRSADREQAEAYPLVRGFTTKPISRLQIRDFSRTLSQLG